jgi:hypothetical protein
VRASKKLEPANDNGGRRRADRPARADPVRARDSRPAAHDDPDPLYDLPDMYDEASDPAVIANREFQLAMPTHAMRDFQSWREDWAWIGNQPMRQRRAVIETLRASTWAMTKWRKCTPRHIRKYWVEYAAGEEPGRPDPSHPSNDNGQRHGPSEVGRPEEFEGGIPPR